MEQPHSRAEHEPGDATTSSSDNSDGIRYLWVWALVAAGIAGLGAWACGEMTLNYFKPSEAAAKNHLDPRALVLELAVIGPRNAAINFGTQGAFLGLLLGFATGLARRSVAGLIAGAIGFLLGALAGIVVPLALVPAFMKSYNPAEPAMMLLVMIRGGIWAAIGAAAGLAFGLGSGKRLWLIRSLLGGLCGGIAGTIFFEICNALIDPLDRNDQTIPTTILARLLSCLFVAAFVTIGAVLSTRHTPPEGSVHAVSH